MGNTHTGGAINTDTTATRQAAIRSIAKRFPCKVGMGEVYAHYGAAEKGYKKKKSSHEIAEEAAETLIDEIKLEEGGGLGDMFGSITQKVKEVAEPMAQQAMQQAEAGVKQAVQQAQSAVTGSAEGGIDFMSTLTGMASPYLDKAKSALGSAEGGIDFMSTLTGMASPYIDKAKSALGSAEGGRSCGGYRGGGFTDAFAQQVSSISQKVQQQAMPMIEKATGDVKSMVMQKIGSAEGSGFGDMFTQKLTSMAPEIAKTAIAEAKKVIPGGCGCPFAGGAEDFDALSVYGNSVYSQAKEKLIRDIAADIASVLGINSHFASSAPISKVVEKLRSVVPDPRKSSKIVSDKQEHVCRQLAKTLNRRFKTEIVDPEASPNEICRAVSELIYSLFVGLHTEFLVVAGDISRVVRNLMLLRDYIDAAFKTMDSEMADSGMDSSSIQRVHNVRLIYEKFRGEVDRQLAILSNVMNVAIEPSSKSMISLLEDTKSLKGLVGDLEESLGTEQFADKLGYMFVGISTTARAAELVDKALKEVGMSLKEYKNAKNLNDLRLKLYGLVAEQRPDSKHLAKLIDALDILYKNNYVRDDVIEYLEHKHINREKYMEKKGRKHGGAAGGIEIEHLDTESNTDIAGRRFLTKKSLSKRIRNQEKTRELLFHDLNKIIQHHYQRIAASVHRIAPKLGNEIPISEEIDNFVRRFKEVPGADRENLHKALSGYRKDINSKHIKNEYMAGLHVLSGALDTLVTKSSKYSDSFREIKASVDNLIMAIDEFNDVFVKSLTELHVEPALVEGGVERYLKQIIDNMSPEVFAHYVTFQQTQAELFYYYRIAGIKKNMGIMASELKDYHSNYENVLGDEIGYMISHITKEYNENLKNADYERTDFNEKCCKDNPYLLCNMFHSGIIKAGELLKNFEKKIGNGLAGKANYVNFIAALAARSGKAAFNIGIAPIVPTVGEVPAVIPAGAAGINQFRFQQQLATNLCNVKFHGTTDCTKDIELPALAGGGVTWTDGANAAADDQVKAVRSALEAAININKERHRVYVSLLKYQKDAKVQLLKTAEAIDLYLQSFTDGINANPDDIKDLLKILEQIDVVARWFNEQSGNNLAKLFESWPQQANRGMQSLIAADVDTPAPIAGEGIATDTKVIPTTGNNTHYYNNLPARDAGEIGDIRTGMVLDSMTQLKGILQHINKSVRGVRALENLIATFVGIGRKFGSKEPAHKTFMSPGQMFKSLMDYMVASSVCIGRDKTKSSAIMELASAIGNTNARKIVGKAYVMGCNAANTAVRAEPIINAAIGSVDAGGDDAAVWAAVQAVLGGANFGNVQSDALAALLRTMAPGARDGIAYYCIKDLSDAKAKATAHGDINADPGVHAAIPGVAWGAISSIIEAYMPTTTNVVDQGVWQPGFIEGKIIGPANPVPHVPKWAIDRVEAQKFTTGSCKVEDQLEIVLRASGHQFENDARDRFFHKDASDKFNETDMIFTNIIKAIVSKIFTTIGVFSMFNRPQIVNEYNSLSALRMIVGGGPTSYTYPEIIDEAIELYIRLPLLAEWYREKFSFVKKDQNTQNYVISMVPSSDGIFSDFIKLIFRDIDYINMSTYTDNALMQIIQAINGIYNAYRSKKYSSKDIILAFVVEINRRYGVIKQAEINAYLNNIRANLNSSDTEYNTSERVDFDLLDEKSSIGRRPAPSDRFQEIGESRLKRKSTRKTLLEEVTKFRESIESEFNKVLRTGTGATGTKKYDYKELNYSFEGSIKQARTALELSRESKPRFEIIAKLIQGVERYTAIETEKLLAFNELVVMPITTLNMVYEILYNFNMFIHMARMDILLKAFSTANAAPTVNSVTDLVGEFHQKATLTKAQKDDIVNLLKQFRPSLAGGIHANAEHATIYYNIIMIKLLDSLTMVGSDLSGLAELRVLGDGMPTIDLSKVQNVCIELFNQVRSIIDRFRPVFPASIIARYENKDKGGISYLEEHLFEKLFNNRDKMGLPEINESIRKTWNSLLSKSALGANADNANRIKYDMAFSRLLYWYHKDCGSAIDFDVLNCRIEQRTYANSQKPPFKLLPLFKNGNYEAKTPEEIRAYDLWRKGTPYGPGFGQAPINPMYGNEKMLDNNNFVDPPNALNADPGPSAVPAWITNIQFNPSWARFYMRNNDMDSENPLAWDPIEGANGLMIVFNDIVARYVYGLLDSSQDKFYLPLIETFANGVLSNQILDGMAARDLGFGPADNNGADALVAGPVGAGASAVDATRVYNQTTRRHDPEGAPAIFSSLAMSIKGIITAQNKLGAKMFSTNSFTDLSYSTKEKLRANLPVFEKLLGMVIAKAIFLKEIMDNASDMLLDRELRTPAGVGAGQVDHIADGQPDVCSAWDADGAPAMCTVQKDTYCSELSAPADANNNVRRAYFRQLIQNIIGGSQNLLKCIAIGQRELNDIPLYMEFSEDGIRDFQTSYGRLPLMPISSLSALFNEENRLQLSFTPGSDKFKMLYATRLILSKNNIEPTIEYMPGMKTIIDEYDAIVDVSAKIGGAPRSVMSRNKSAELIVNTVKLVRYVTDITNWKVLMSNSSIECPEIISQYTTNAVQAPPGSDANLVANTNAISIRFRNDLKTNIGMPLGFSNSMQRIINDDVGVLAAMNVVANNLNDKFTAAVDYITTNHPYLSDEVVLAYARARYANSGVANAADVNDPLHADYNTVKGIAKARCDANKATTYYMYLTTERITPAQHDTVIGQHKPLSDVITLTEAGNHTSNIKHIVERVDIHVNFPRGMDNGREQLRILNILDMNIVPINIHALQREIPLINLHNYSYSFDRMIQEFIVPNEYPTQQDPSKYIMDQDVAISDTSKMLCNMLIYPYHHREGRSYYTWIPRLMAGDTKLDLGVPKYLSDQLWNKVLLNTSTYFEPIDEAGARSENPLYRSLHRDFNNVVQLANDTPSTTMDPLGPGPAPPLQPSVATDAGAYARGSPTTTVTYSYKNIDRRQDRQMVPVMTHAKVSRLVYKGKERYDTILIRNLEWVTNIQRVMRLIMRDHLRWVSTPVVSGLSIATRNMTEYTPGNTLSHVDVDVDYM